MRLARAVIVAVAAAGVLASTVVWLGVTRGDADGEQAFEGRSPLSARIDGHESTLPARASACANCHRPSASPAGGDGTPAPAASLGPRLTRAGLLEPAARRGGPPSRYDEAAFCRLLRTGQDPAGVMLPRAMPRYELSDADCMQLWRHLTRRAL
jgi:hypothetical protein